MSRLSVSIITLSRHHSFTKVARHDLLYHLPKITDPNSRRSWPILAGIVQQSWPAANPISQRLSDAVMTLSRHRLFKKVARHHLLYHLPPIIPDPNSQSSWPILDGTVQ
ncbi:hypothetical protein Pyn_22917 [Prunus yedoensis var. nudiflora]|uniref:Uncharacterized protein n=1 Tax=Prunus yedoensis var. nudiflora TaxID=2094558 RepID=A0A314US89_PRUYE|nr:hypothetical protein Pyn_22917 [Prunus yedoensis var. nudiflora]